MSTFRPRVAGIGLSCPVGLRCAPALAAIRAGITRIQLCEHVIGRGDTVSASMLLEPPLPEDRVGRAGFFARHAVAEALGSVQWNPDEPIPCVLALPEPGSNDLDWRALASMLTELPLANGRKATVALHRPITQGRTGVFAALQATFAMLESGRDPLVLIGGVDSQADLNSLNALVSANRVLGPANPDGVCPGEAAACVVLGHPKAVPSHKSMAMVTLPATAIEPISFRRADGRVSNAQGLGQVFRNLLARVGERVDEVFAGTTTEGFFGREFSHAYLRAPLLMPEPLRIQNVGQALGDVGAASGAVALVQAIASLERPSSARSTDGNRSALAYASHDSGHVGGCVVFAPDPRER